jgi:hypothetical protein
MMLKVEGPLLGGARLALSGARERGEVPAV